VESTKELEVEALSAGGRGVARHAGLVWFLPGTVPGDRVLARGVERGRRFVEGSVERMLEPSRLRRTPPCPYQSRCGGCPWMVLEEAQQRTWKRRLVADALTRLARLPTEPLEEIEAGEALGYRNKVEFSVGRGADGLPVIGLYRPGGTELLDVESCRVQHPSMDRVLHGARAFLRRPGSRPGEAAAATGEPPRLVLRRASASGEILIVLREVTRRFPRAAALARHLLKAHPEVVGVVRLRARAGRRGGAAWQRLAGRGWIDERLAGIRFRIRAGIFTQINPEMAELLLNRVVELAGDVDGARVLDLYGGIGVYGITLARRAREVTVCDADPEAVRCGRDATRDLPAGRIRFLRSDAQRCLADRAREGTYSDLVVANPPRTGMPAGVARGIVAQQPGRIVLVSCDPATLARDLRRLVDGGYRLIRAVPLDLFPQTAHVETVALLRKA